MNDEQIAHWNGPAGQRWTAHQLVLDRALAAYGQQVLERANARPGEHVVDVGCGCGATTLALSDSVAAQGSVLGVDVSAEMLERARQRAGQRSNLTFVQGDAAALRYERAFDLVFSRFGVMFFEDPVAAFRNLHAATRPDGRLVFVCWRAFEDNLWASVPTAAVRCALPEFEAPPLSAGPGPYAFADRAKLEGIVADAGFCDVACERFDADVVLGSQLEEAVEFALSSGPTSRWLVQTTPEQQARAKDEVRRVLAPLQTAQGFALLGSSWIVTARG